MNDVKDHVELAHTTEVASRSRRFAAKSLAGTLIKRVNFDPANQKHRESLLHFIEHGKWTIHFNAELPHHGVLETVKHKMVLYALTH